jgi:hypothetical protein
MGTVTLRGARHQAQVGHQRACRVPVAVLTMFILLSPFIIPLYIKESDDQNRAFVVNTLSLSTLTLFAFAIISVLYTPASSGVSLIHLP